MTKNRVAVLFNEDGSPQAIGRVIKEGKGGSLWVSPRGVSNIPRLGMQSWPKKNCKIFKHSKLARRSHEG